MGRHECEAGYGFVESAPAGSVLERAIRRCGFRRENFAVWNLVPAHPPNDHLEGASYEAEAIAWGLAQLPEIIERFKPRVILCLGGVAFKAITGLSGILESRGYPVRSRFEGISAIGALHPSFLRRGAMGYLSALMHDIRFAVALAAVGFAGLERRIYQPIEFWSPVLWRQVRYEIPWPLAPLNQPVVPPDYALYPTEDVAKDFLRDAKRDASRLIAYDIETPRSVKAGEEASDEPDESPIISVQFSLAPGSGIFLPYRAPFINVIRAVLALANPKLGCNNWRFDDPRLVKEGFAIAGTRHDLRWAFKHMQPDLSAALQAITSYYAPDFGPWKHLDSAFPQFYGIRDVDAPLRCV